MELHPNFQEDPAFLCSFGQLRGYIQYSALPRLETHSVIFPARVICSSSFFSVPLSLIFKYCVPERQSTKTPCPTSHQWDELPQPCDMPCTIPPSHLLFARFFHKTHLPCAPPILHKIVPKSLRARTPTFFSLSASLPCSITYYPAWICAVLQGQRSRPSSTPTSVLCLDQTARLQLCVALPQKLLSKKFSRREKYHC